MSSRHRPKVLLLGQTPPPWHGQAVATQLLFEHDWRSLDVTCLRMEFSSELEDVGRFQFRKIRHLLDLILKTRSLLRQDPGSILFYPPASARWIPFLRDVIILCAVRHLAARTVFIFHAAGLASFCMSGPIRGWLANLAYGHADLALEVAQEEVAPHLAFDIKSWQWSPCGIDVPTPRDARMRPAGPLTCLFIGSLQEGKGVLEILKTASRLREMGHGANFRFRIVGRWFSESFKDEAMALHEQLDLDDMVEWAGELTGEAKWQAYHQADLFFFPTHYPSEASPIVLMEALGSGLPILSTQWAGIPAMLDGCGSATLLPIRSPERFAEALVQHRQQHRTAQQIASDSRAFYEAHFTPKQFIDRVEKAILNIGL